MSSADSFPRHSARTRRFTLGDPRTFSVCRDGSLLLFLRALAGDDPMTALWALDLDTGQERLVVDPREWQQDTLSDSERARRERVRERASGVVAYSADRAGRVAVFVRNGALCVVDLDTGEQREVDKTEAVFDPRVSPDGSHVAYVSGDVLNVVELAGGVPRVLIDDEASAVSWGRAEHAAAEEMDRTRGFWWNPDGSSLLVTRVDESDVNTWWLSDPAHPERQPRAQRYPAAGTANADVTLHIVDLHGKVTDVGWDNVAFPYLARVVWEAGHQPLLQVQSRDQRRIATLSVDPTDGSTSVLYDDTDPVWVEVFDGVPCWCSDDVVRIVDDGSARQLVVGDDAVTAAELYVRAVAGADDDTVTFTASYDDPTQVHVVQWHRRHGVQPLTERPGVHTVAAPGAGVFVVTSASLDSPGRRHELRSPRRTQELTTLAEQSHLTPQVRLLTVGARQLRAGLVLPSTHEPGNRWPVLLDPYGGPHAQRVLAARSSWLEPQWLADQGFAVLVVDGRGTPGRDPDWERAVHHDLAVTVEDQVDALRAAAELEPALDLSRVGIRGWSFGGYLAALAVLRRPDVFGAAVAGAPVIDWRLYDTHYTERYLGMPDEQADVYERNSLLADAPALTRPLLLIHGLADDNVVAAHTLLFSQLLTNVGRPHSVLPLTGVTHMASQEEVAENLLLLQVEFLHRALG
jgi:dipeptidyl-peptidase-4